MNNVLIFRSIRMMWMRSNRDRNSLARNVYAWEIG